MSTADSCSIVSGSTLPVFLERTTPVVCFNKLQKKKIAKRGEYL
jgi:hypothetical protein